MTTLTMAAINEEHFPLNFLAALGIQHVVGRTTGLDVRLHWVQQPLWTAVLSGMESRESLMASLRIAAQRVSDDPVWTGMGTERSVGGRPPQGITQLPVDMYRTRMQPMAWSAEAWRWTGLVTEWPSTKKKAEDATKAVVKAVAQAAMAATGNAAEAESNAEMASGRAADQLKTKAVAASATVAESHADGPSPSASLFYLTPSQLHMITGGQTDHFLEFVRDAATVAARKPDAITEALWGPWRFEDSPAAHGKGWDETSLGWDAAMQRRWALTERQPEKMKKTTVAAIIWLAAEGLRALPTWSGGAQPHTVGISEHEFTFPLWTTPLSLSAATRLLMSISEDHAEEWRRRGVATLQRCQRGSSGTDYKPVLLPPTVLW